ncbi:toxin-antitoxin system HicB family antitoxin [Raineyella antarctica]|nr:toxin-antitoxin system HicB family antitoxin [Raineyella antarctica]
MAMTLRLEPQDEKALALLAEAQGVSKQEATVNIRFTGVRLSCGRGPAG